MWTNTKNVYNVDTSDNLSESEYHVTRETIYQNGPQYSVDNILRNIIENSHKKNYQQLEYCTNGDMIDITNHIYTNLVMKNQKYSWQDQAQVTNSILKKVNEYYSFVSYSC